MRPSLPGDLSFFIDFKDFKSSDSVISPSHFITCPSWSFGTGKFSKRETTFCFEIEIFGEELSIKKLDFSIHFNWVVNFLFIFNKCMN